MIREDFIQLIDPQSRFSLNPKSEISMMDQILTSFFLGNHSVAFGDIGKFLESGFHSKTKMDFDPSRG